MIILPITKVIITENVNYLQTVKYIYEIKNPKSKQNSQNYIKKTKLSVEYCRLKLQGDSKVLSLTNIIFN